MGAGSAPVLEFRTGDGVRFVRQLLARKHDSACEALDGAETVACRGCGVSHLGSRAAVTDDREIGTHWSGTEPVEHFGLSAQPWGQTSSLHRNALERFGCAAGPVADDIHPIRDVWRFLAPQGDFGETGADSLAHAPSNLGVDHPLGCDRNSGNRRSQDGRKFPAAVDDIEPEDTQWS